MELKTSYLMIRFQVLIHISMTLGTFDLEFTLDLQEGEGTHFTNMSKTFWADTQKLIQDFQICHISLKQK